MKDRFLNDMAVLVFDSESNAAQCLPKSIAARRNERRWRTRQRPLVIRSFKKPYREVLNEDVVKAFFGEVQCVPGLGSLGHQTFQLRLRTTSERLTVDVMRWGGRWSAMVCPPQSGLMAEEEADTSIKAVRAACEKFLSNCW